MKDLLILPLTALATAPPFADAIYLLNYLFASGTPPVPPHGAPGSDPTDDALGGRGF